VKKGSSIHAVALLCCLFALVGFNASMKIGKIEISKSFFKKTKHV